MLRLSIGQWRIRRILSLDWSSGIETLKCVDRVDLTLSGSFADMILTSNASAAERNDTISLFVLTNPGQLHFYDNACLSDLKSGPEKKHHVHAVEYPVVIPTVEPNMTVGKLRLVSTEESFSRALTETVSAAKLQDAMTTRSTKWPLTGGIPSQLSFGEENRIERIYIAGYQDGSVRVWDATFPVLSFMFVLGHEVEGIEIAGASSSISALDFSSTTLSLAIGNEGGLVRIHSLSGSFGGMNFQFVTEAKREVHKVPLEHRLQCIAAFSILKSPVRTLQYLNNGVRLAVGFECGQVAVLDISTLSVLFLTDSVSASSSAVISVALKTYPNTSSDNLNHHEKEMLNESSSREVAFILTRDAHIIVMDGITGNMISSQPMHPRKESTAVSMYILESNVSNTKAFEKQSPISSQDVEAKSELVQTNSQYQSDSTEVEYDTSSEAKYLGQRYTDSLILLCCEDALCLYSSNFVIQGENNYIHKVNLAKPCCWTTIFKKDGKECGLVMVYQTGVIEIRSLPYLEVVGETSLMATMRWNFKTNMDKMMSSSDKGQITLVNGCEFAFISLLAFENDFRIPEALPCLHDRVLAAAPDAAVSLSQSQKKKQSTAPGIIGGIIKGFKGGKVEQGVNLAEAREITIAHLEGIFSRFLFSDPFKSIGDDQKAVELNIDDIAIDEPVPVTSSFVKSNNNKTDKEKERERLFEGGSTDTKPKLRTREEIIAKYRKAGDTSSVAAHARDKLVERQEKLENISRRTAELQSGAENFASMADELVKTMQNRKWWHI
ncbi:unnamed protein product [Ilex paraguariensis]|uniref:V-SNARE coiled-coil homology domain-containing protein n=1 Tax=Ilex paraguariensis TaxID=185542 RepID=A0ABC8TVN0_9AQUA